MKKSVLAVAVALLVGVSSVAVAGEADKEKATREWSDEAAMSYILGTQIGQLSVDNNVKVDMELVKEGRDDLISGKELALNPQDITKRLRAFKNKTQKKQFAAVRAVAEINQKKSEEFLEKNKEKKGVKVTKSGLQYRVIKKGKGKTPGANDTVKVHYKGTLVDGKEFDSSFKRSAPATFNTSRVIKGWTEGLQLMKVGSKYEFVIPSGLAYGNNAPPSIGPGQALVFEVELLEIL